MTSSEACLIPPDNGAHVPLQAHFAYDVDDPAAVEMTFVIELELDDGGIGRDHQTWLIARELLDSALSRPGQEIGEGDCRMTYDEKSHALVVKLMNSETNEFALIDLDAEHLPGFIRMTFLAVSAEEMILRLEEEVAADLGGEPSC